MTERLLRLALIGPWSACTAGWALIVTASAPFTDWRSRP